MERVVLKTRSFAEAEAWDRQQSWALTPSQRFLILQLLREGVHGPDAPDVRISERNKTR